jgi:hypothetical protein
MPRHVGSDERLAPNRETSIRRRDYYPGDSRGSAFIARIRFQQYSAGIVYSKRINIYPWRKEVKIGINIHKELVHIQRWISAAEFS